MHPLIRHAQASHQALMFKYAGCENASPHTISGLSFFARHPLPDKPPLFIIAISAAKEVCRLNGFYTRH